MSWTGRLIRHVRDRTRRYFFTGLLVIVPLGLTYYVVSAIVQWMDRILTYLPPRFHPDAYLPFPVPGLGVITTLVVIQMVGFLGANLLGKKIVGAYERVLARIPVVRTLYVAVKQLLEQILSGDDDRFRKVVLVEYPRKGIYSIAFVTGVAKGQIQDCTASRVLNVFVPTTPNPTSGYYLLIPERDTTPLGIGVEQAFKLIMSAGIVGWDPTNEKARSTGERAEHDGPMCS